MFFIRKALDKQISFFVETIMCWAYSHYAQYPWRSTSNHWHALVAEIMLQRTNAEQVLPVYLVFCSRYKTPLDYLIYNKGDTFDSLGLKWREMELLKLATLLCDSDIPEDKMALLQLPGVGDYIASAYRSLHLGLYDFIIDNNIVRLYGRYLGFKTDGETRRKKYLKRLAVTLTPRRTFKIFNYGLIDFTRNICKNKPLCVKCPLNSKCDAFVNSYMHK